MQLVQMDELENVNAKGDVMTDLQKRFTYHSPKNDQPARYQSLRDMGLRFAELIAEHCPDSRERSLALTKAEEAIMWANASIARNE